MKFFKNIFGKRTAKLVLVGLLLIGISGCTTADKYLGNGDGKVDLKSLVQMGQQNEMIRNSLASYGIKLPDSEKNKAPDIIASGTQANVYYRLKSTGAIISLDDIERIVVINSVTPFPLPVPTSDKYDIKINQPSSSLVIPFSPVAPTNAPIATATNSVPEAVEPPIDTPDAPADLLDGPDNGSITVAP